MSVDPDVWAYLYVFAVISFALAVSLFWTVLDWITLVVTRPFKDGVAEELVNGEIVRVQLQSARTRLMIWVASWRHFFRLLAQPSYLVRLFKVTYARPQVRREVGPALLKQLINWRAIVFLVWLYLASQISVMTFSYDPYHVLGIPSTSTKQEVASAYRKLARKFRPDQEQAPEVQAQWMRIAKAYKTLKEGDEEARADLEGMGDTSDFGMAVPSFLLGRNYKKMTAVIYLACLLGLVVFAVRRISKQPDKQLVERLEAVVGFAKDFQSIAESWPSDVADLHPFVGIPDEDTLAKMFGDAAKAPTDMTKLDALSVESAAKKIVKTIEGSLPFKSNPDALETAERAVVAATTASSPTDAAVYQQVMEWSSRGLFMRANAEPNLTMAVRYPDRFKWELAVSLAAREVAVGQELRQRLLVKVFDVLRTVRGQIEADRLKGGGSPTSPGGRSANARVDSLRLIVKPLVEHWLAQRWAVQEVQHAATLLATRGAGFMGIGDADRWRPFVDYERKRLEKQREQQEMEQRRQAMRR